MMIQVEAIASQVACRLEQGRESVVPRRKYRVEAVCHLVIFPQTQGPILGAIQGAIALISQIIQEMKLT